MNENKQLCPNCKTLKLDRYELICPYMEYHNGTACAEPNRSNSFSAISICSFVYIFIYSF